MKAKLKDNQERKMCGTTRDTDKKSKSEDRKEGRSPEEKRDTERKKSEMNTRDKKEITGEKEDSHDSRIHTSQRRRHFFKNLAVKMRKCDTYQHLENLVEAEWGVVNGLYTIKYKPYQPSVVKLDTSSLDLYPDDVEPKIPVGIYGDGNCLPRCASSLAFGNEDEFVEMRVWIVIEMVQHARLYGALQLTSWPREQI